MIFLQTSLILCPFCKKFVGFRAVFGRIGEMSVKVLLAKSSWNVGAALRLSSATFDKRMSKTRRVKFFRANEGVFSAEKGGEVEIFINFVGD